MNISKFANNIILVAGSCLFISAPPKPLHHLSVNNPSRIERPDELIVIQRKDFEKKMGSIPPKKFVVLSRANTTPIPVQYDDTDGDNVWDQLVFLYSFNANERTELSVSISDAPLSVKSPVRAHVRLRKKNNDNSFGALILKDTMPYAYPPTDFSKNPLPLYLTEGPAWENDKVAFRQYFDTRNSRDIFGKQIPEMMMDTIGTREKSNYHELDDWGMDILQVGNSLGAGSVALAVKDIHGKETLYALGGLNVKKETYECVADGPLRAVFRIIYNWEINNIKIQVIDETSIWGGQYFYESKLELRNAPSGSRLVAGFPDLRQNSSGTIETRGSKICYSFGEQSENKDNLGLGIAMSDKDFKGFGYISDSLAGIEHSYGVYEQIVPGNMLKYRFYAAWSKSDQRFRERKGFVDFLNDEAMKYAEPLRINIE